MKLSLYGWLGIAAWVVLFDAWAITTKNATLSAGFRAARRHPRRRFAVLGLWVLITTHLCFDTP